MSEEFRKCLKLERDRARSRRESAQGMFEASMLSLDRLFDTFEDPSKAAAFSDGGAGEERIVANYDGDYSLGYYRACVKRAMNRLRKRSELRRTLRDEGATVAIRSHGRGWRTERKVKQTWTEIG